MTAAIASPSAAQVMAIGDDGSATIYAAPSVFTEDGAAPIAVGSQVSLSPTALDIRRAISEAGARHQVSVDLITEVAWRESRFRQSAVSSRDAVGIMQLTAGTARELGVDRHDAQQNIQGGAAYLRKMLDRYGGSLTLALAAYNAGPGAVDRYRGVPPFRETNAYVAAILARLSERALNAAPAASVR